MVALRVTSVSLFLALAACSVGEVPIGGTPPADGPAATPDAPSTTGDGPTTPPPDAPGGGGDPSASYTAMVFPLVSNDSTNGRACNSSGCHSPGGQPPDFATFASFDKKYRTKPGSAAKVITKGPHSGPALTDKAKATFISWIDSVPDGM